MTVRLPLIAALSVLHGCTLVGPSRGSYYLEDRVPPVAETAPVASGLDAADDPAIWIHPDDPAASLIVATDKRSGLYVYELDGSVRQYLALGNTNNVDLRTAPWANRELTLVAASGRFPSELLLLAIDHESRELRLLERYPVRLGEPYGICMYLDERRRPYVFLNSVDGTFVQFSVDTAYRASEVRRFRFASQVEGCVADDDRGILYVAEENRGIWRMAADARAHENRELVDSVRGGHLTRDVEGLALYDGPRTLLIASSQGDNSYAIYDASTSEHLSSFHVAGNPLVDDVSETDGIEVTAVSLPGFPHGMLVVQDGSNTNPDENQNFKLVSWSDVLGIVPRN